MAPDTTLAQRGTDKLSGGDVLRTPRSLLRTTRQQGKSQGLKEVEVGHKTQKGDRQQLRKEDL